MATHEPALSLAALSDEAFNDLVNQDVRGKLDPDTAAMLRTDELVDRWYANLLSLKRSVEAQLTSNRAEQLQKQAEYLALGDQGLRLWKQFHAQSETWRAGAIRFKNGVEDRLTEAKLLRSKLRATTEVDLMRRERDRLHEEVFKLRRGILDHREFVTQHDDEDTVDADELLWRLVDAG